jgi:hypothetical protein
MSLSLFNTITDGLTDELNISVFSKKLKKNYCKCHRHSLITDNLIMLVIFKKSPMKLHIIFLSVIYYIHQRIY